ncbi:MAG: glycosyltransferase family 2 protein [Chloroflexota bacterium]
MTSPGLPVSQLKPLAAARVDLSIVVPVFEEAESIPELHRQLDQAISTLDRSVEIIFVDDGSRDATLDALQSVFEQDGRVRVISLRRNFGKMSALLAGFAEVRGELVATLDGDLQDDPSELPRFLEAIDGGMDLVSGWKRVRHDPITKTLPSRLFNLTVRRTTGIPLHDFNCGFKVYRRQVLEEVKLYGEMHRFIPVIAQRKGFRIGELEVQHHPRRFGRSKFGASRMIKGFLDFAKVMFLTRYMQRPLQLFGVLGMILALLGGVGFVYLLILKLLGQSVFQAHGPLLLLSSVLVVSGIQLFVLGLMGKMLRHQSFEPREEYSVRRHLNHERED